MTDVLSPATVGEPTDDLEELMRRSRGVFRRGETADAEPAVPGWRFAGDELFD